jgi:hypothetical protein
MGKKTVRLDSDVSKLVNYYLEHNDLDFDQLLNKAIKAYIINQLDSKQAQRILQAGDHDDEAPALNRFLHDSFNWFDEG